MRQGKLVMFGVQASGVLAGILLLLHPGNAGAQDCGYPAGCIRPTDIYLRISTEEIRHSLNPAERLGPYLNGALVDPLIYAREPIHYVSSVRGFRRVLQSMAHQCKRVATLDLISHGDPGSAQLADGEYITADSIRAELTGLHCVMAPGATLYFSGCNIGRGCRGSDFMLEAGRTLLRGRGGRVLAPNQFAYTAFAIPGDVIPNEMRFNAAGEPVSRNFEVPSAAVCADRVSALITGLENLRDKDACLFNGATVSSQRGAVLESLRRVERAYRSAPLSVPGSRERSSPELRAVDGFLETAVYSAHVLMNHADSFECGDDS